EGAEVRPGEGSPDDGQPAGPLEDQGVDGHRLDLAVEGGREVLVPAAPRRRHVGDPRGQVRVGGRQLLLEDRDGPGEEPAVPEVATACYIALGHLQRWFLDEAGGPVGGNGGRPPPPGGAGQ